MDFVADGQLQTRNDGTDSAALERVSHTIDCGFSWNLRNKANVCGLDAQINKNKCGGHSDSAIYCLVLHSARSGKNARECGVHHLLDILVVFG